jgi:hypothetical protein
MNKWQAAALAIFVLCLWGGPLLALECDLLKDRKRRKAVDEEFTPVAPDRAALEAPPTQWVYIDPRGRFGTQGH